MRAVCIGMAVMIPLLTANVSLAVVGHARPGSNASGPWGTDLACTSRQIRLFAEKLNSSRPGELREAQERLAWAGASGLQYVDSMFASGSIRDTSRVKAYLGRSMLFSVTVQQLKRFPRLNALAQNDIASGFVLATVVIGDTLPYSAEPGHVKGIAARQSNRPSPDRGPSLSQLGGFAVPAATMLCHHPNAKVRGQGVNWIRALRAFTAYALLDSMRTDSGHYGAWHGDYSTSESVGNSAGSLANEFRDGITGPYRYEFVIPDYENSALINGLRQYAHTLHQPTWDDWWNAARPAWNLWWDMWGESPGPATADEWTKRLQESEGWRLDFEPNDKGPAIAEVLGSKSNRCEIWIDGHRVRNASLPVSISSASDTLLRDEWLKMGSYSQKDVHVIVHRQDGSSFDRYLVVAPGTLRLTVLDQPREIH